MRSIVPRTRLTVVQVEFYFSDSNLPFDKFLFGMVSKHNKPVPVKLIASFKRMRRFKDHATIVAALKDSEMLELGGDEGDETIKRKVPLAIGEIETKPEEVKELVIKKVFDRALKTSMYAVCGYHHLLFRARVLTFGAERIRRGDPDHSD